MAEQNQDGGDKNESKKKRFLGRYGCLLILFLTASFVVGIVLRNPGLLSNPTTIVEAITNGNVHLSSSPTPSVEASPPTSASPADNSPLKTPNDYLDLMSSDPSTLPPVEQPIAIALNKVGYGMRDADIAQRNAEKDFQTRALDPIQAPKDKQLLENVKTYATNLKTTSEKRITYYKGIEALLGADLKAAGTQDEMVTKVITLFVQRSGVVSGITRSEAVVKASDDILTIVDHLQKNHSKWKCGDDGKLAFFDREAMNTFNALIQMLNTDLHAVQPSITAS